MAAESIRLRVNGVDQGLFLEGLGPDRPVLLFVHGGPGMPMYWLTRWHRSRLHEAFTVAWWEQRGAGLSYSRDVPATSMTVAQLVEDTCAVAEQLGRRFGTERVHLLGHSWGSFLGLQAASLAPELFATYIGMSQVTHQVQSEVEAYRFMLARYRDRGDRRMVGQLQNAPVTGGVPLPRGYERIRDRAMHRLGVGTTHRMHSVVTGIFLPSLRAPAYSWTQRVGLWRGRRFSRGSGMWDQMLATDLRGIDRLEVPAYFLHGLHDRTVSYDLARAYARTLRAPSVGFYTFPDSAHCPAFEEPDRAWRILTEDVLRGRTDLADED